ncbi:putative CRISPR-associated protein, VVA1548 family [Pasteurella multocida]|nr:putative CRISPR-associated protein, VVA1548 family [Pasteurella multocida]
MAVWFVSRHQGAIDWIQQQGIHIDRFENHLNVDDIQADDVVIGTLPIHLAAQVCEKGAKFYFLSINVTAQQRGTELNVQQLNEQACSLQPFLIQKL